MQNFAARVVTQTGRREHITPVLYELHWLPVRSRITYKVLLLTYKALHGLAPAYIGEMVTPYQPARPLRSANKALLADPNTKLKTWGDRTFQHAAAVEWKALPETLRKAPSLTVFKKNLKTHLFCIAFA